MVKPGAQVMLIGAISQYNVAQSSRPPHLLDQFQGSVARFSDGIENAPAAFIGMMRGANTGKTLVRLAHHLVS